MFQQQQQQQHPVSWGWSSPMPDGWPPFPETKQGSQIQFSPISLFPALMSRCVVDQTHPVFPAVRHKLSRTQAWTFFYLSFHTNWVFVEVCVWFRYLNRTNESLSLFSLISRSFNHISCFLTKINQLQASLKASLSWPRYLFCTFVFKRRRWAICIIRYSSNRSLQMSDSCNYRTRPDVSLCCFLSWNN